MNLICLMYHRLVSPTDYPRTAGTERIFALPTDAFEQQLAYLLERGHRFVSAAEALAFVNGGALPAENCILLTFDDGCQSVHSLVRPVLAKLGLPAVAFVTVDPNSYVFGLGDVPDRRMTDDELRECAASGIAIECHGLTHRPLRGLNDDEVRHELTASKQELERILGREVRCLSVPGNWWDGRILAIAREVGYTGVWVSNAGSIRRQRSPYGLPRINVEGQLNLSEFARLVSPAGIARKRLFSGLKGLPGRLLGPKLWLPLRKLILGLLPGHRVTTRGLAVAAGAAAVLMIAVVAWLVL